MNHLRQRRYRQRLAAGIKIVPIAVDEVAVGEVLVGGGYLSPHQADDPEAFRAALEKMIAALALVDLHRIGDA